MMPLKLLSSSVRAGRVSERQTILCSCHAVLFGNNNNASPTEGSERKINFLLRPARLLPSSSVLVRPLPSWIAGARSAHARSLSALESIDLTTAAPSGWGGGRGALWERRADNGDHKAISTTLTCALEPRLRVPTTPRGTSRSLKSFISRPKLAPPPSLSTRWLRLGESQ